MAEKHLRRRQEIHTRVVSFFVELVGSLILFFSFFGLLMIAINFGAYAKVFHDWIFPAAIIHELPPSVFGSSDKSPSTSFSNEGNRIPWFFEEPAPNDMRLEIPKVFSGTVPIATIPETDFRFTNFRDSESRIQLALQRGVVKYPYTANPDQFGNVFVTGHSSYYPWDNGKYKDIFALLHTLEKGDQYHIYFKGRKYEYRVEARFEIEPDEMSVLEQPIDQKISTLMTCSPLGTNLRRLVVRGVLENIHEVISRFPR